MISENPYRSPETQSPTRQRSEVGLLRMMCNGLFAGTLIGLGTGAVAGSALFLSLWWKTTFAGAAFDSLAMAESSAMHIFRGVFTGAIAGFAMMAPLGAALGGVAAFCPIDGRRGFVVVTAVLNVAAFSLVGSLIPEWPAPLSAIATGLVGIGGGMMLGRVLADMAGLPRRRATARRP